MNLGGNNDPSQRLRWITFGLLFGLALLLLILDATRGVEGAFSFIRNPIASLMDWTADRTDAYADVLAGPRDLQLALAQIEQLEEENAALRREMEVMREMQAENQILREYFDYASLNPTLDRLLANVIARDTSPTFQSLIIDRGTADGILVGMPVESTRGLVGVIYRADARSSQVLLLTDNISNVAARLGESRATGVLQGGGLGGTLYLDWISLEASVTIGDLVVTSGLGDKFPADVPIGRVIDVQRLEADLFQRAVVQPAVDFANLEAVFVITNFNSVDTEVFDQVP
ncbi:MAG: rod shape-determining protein MreC [Chloroflexi bacterium]|nr:rod shape-determining protein MreC [Chloroflexota bacterium]